MNPQAANSRQILAKSGGLALLLLLGISICIYASSDGRLPWPPRPMSDGDDSPSAQSSAPANPVIVDKGASADLPPFPVAPSMPVGSLQKDGGLQIPVPNAPAVPILPPGNSSSLDQQTPAAPSAQPGPSQKMPSAQQIPNAPSVLIDPNPLLPLPQRVGVPISDWKYLANDRVDRLRAKLGIASQWPSCDQNVPGSACPLPQDVTDRQEFVQDVMNPRHTLTLVHGRTSLMVLKAAPKRVQIGEEKIADFTLLSAREVSLHGKSLGSTVFNLWFADPADKDRTKVVSYLLRVVPDPETLAKEELRYKVLAAEIARAFPDSHVSLSVVGQKLVVSGQAKDIFEATQILMIARANVPKQDAAKLPVDNVNVNVNAGAPGSANANLNNLFQAAGPNVVNMLRIPGEQQVMLRVTVAEVNRAAARSIGLNFNSQVGSVSFANNTGNIAGALSGLTSIASATGGIPGAALGAGAGAVTSLAVNNLPIGLDNGQTTLAINALRNLNCARSLAEPNLTALNGETARFLAGGEFPVPVVTGATAVGLQGVNFIPYGVQLNFTPYITDRNRIRLNLSAAVSTRDLSSGSTISGANVSGLTTRNFQTTVELREGQTLAVAGLIQNNLGAQTARIPFLGDIPIVGRALGFDQLSAGEQELVVLVTPELVHPLDPCETPKRLPGSDLFEPSDLEFYVLGRIESRRSYDYRSPVMTDFARMSRYHKCEQIYIFGPSGHSDSGDGK